MAGLAPWISLPDDDSQEGKMRKQIREWALKSYRNAVDPDNYRISSSLRKIKEWYVGDGWYSDGPHFAFDYYNSYVIHPMYVECLEVLTGGGKYGGAAYSAADFNEAVGRMQRFGMILERLISPEGTYPAVGRSITYRTGVLQPLAMLAWRGWLPGELSEGQVRAAMTAVIENMFGDSRNYNKKGFLTLGFNGSQPEISDYYTNNGSLYMASLAFLPLGLPADDPFWTSEAEDWTSKKSLGRQGFPERPFIQIGMSRPDDSEKTINFIRNFWLIGLIWIILQELS